MTPPPLTATVGAIMSYSLQTVDAAALIANVIGRLRRIGHEGFPVVSAGRIVGLLTRRDADRAAEHGLPDLRVRDVMLAGTITVTPHDAIETALRRMVETGWWQIPVIDADGQPIGIVTRTDVLKWWAGRHAAEPTVTRDTITRVLGKAVSAVIHAVIAAAAAQGVTVYLVGGIVRDLLLERPSDDVDFVVEAATGDAAPFGTAAARLAETLARRFGGTVQIFRPFGTAKWIPAPETAAALGVSGLVVPDHIDFASARAEFYEQPTALPTVYTSSIKLDLARRDFTLNALALRLISPQTAALIDYFGGLADLHAGRLRVLHPLSFVDDPTRMLRAARFETRFGFALDPRTADLLTLAVPLLGRVTGERVRTEISLLLHEADPVRGLRLLAERGCLTALHPAFTLAADLDAQLTAQFAALRALALPPADHEIVGWHLLAAALPADQVAGWAARLLLPGRLTDAIGKLHDVLAKRDRLSDPALPVSTRARWLDALSPLSLTAAALVLHADPAGAFVAHYRDHLRDHRPVTTGADLKQRGLPPGPCYGRILDRLLDAYRAGLISDRAGEDRLVEEWLTEGICDGG